MIHFVVYYHLSRHQHFQSRSEHYPQNNPLIGAKRIIIRYRNAN